MALKEAVHDVAPDAPVAPHLQQNAPLAPGGLSHGVLKILGGISCSIIDRHRLVVGRRRWWGFVTSFGNHWNHHEQTQTESHALFHLCPPFRHWETSCRAGRLALPALCRHPTAHSPRGATN